MAQIFQVWLPPMFKSFNINSMIVVKILQVLKDWLQVWIALSLFIELNEISDSF